MDFADRFPKKYRHSNHFLNKIDRELTLTLAVTIFFHVNNILYDLRFVEQICSSQIK